MAKNQWCVVCYRAEQREDAETCSDACQKLLEATRAMKARQEQGAPNAKAQQIIDALQYLNARGLIREVGGEHDAFHILTRRELDTEERAMLTRCGFHWGTDRDWLIFT